MLTCTGLQIKVCVSYWIQREVGRVSICVGAWTQATRVRDGKVCLTQEECISAGRSWRCWSPHSSMRFSQEAQKKKKSLFSKPFGVTKVNHIILERKTHWSGKKGGGSFIQKYEWTVLRTVFLEVLRNVFGAWRIQAFPSSTIWPKERNIQAEEKQQWTLLQKHLHKLTKKALLLLWEGEKELGQPRWQERTGISGQNKWARKWEGCLGLLVKNEPTT